MRAIEQRASGEEQLVEAAQRDPARFAALYEANFHRVYAYVARRVPGRAEAEDVTSEVFHRALANLRGFEWRGAPFLAWLLGIAAHAIASRWRGAVLEFELDGETLVEPGAEREVERQALLSQLVTRLPADQRHVIRRRFAEQASIREIARELGRSEGAIKQLQFRALQSLRAHVGGNDDKSYAR